MHNYYFLLIFNTGAADGVIFLAGAKTDMQAREECRAEREARGAECLNVLAVAVRARSHSDACLAVARGQYRAVEAA